MIWPLLFVILVITNSFAQLSPGDLSKYHAALEGLNNCTQCHELRNEVTAAKCLACHKAVARRIEENRGYHSSAEVKRERCAKCHAEHFGRDFNLVYWKEGREKFDHSRTGYQLLGAHAKLECAKCHTTAFQTDAAAFDSTSDRARSFLGLSQPCISCHADEHGEQLTNDCASCHGYDKWTPAPQFSHDKSRYPLTGKHRDVACAKCHKSESSPESTAPLIADPVRPLERSVYQGVDFANCKSCHNDVHEGKFGVNCSGCHTTESFAVAQMAKDFDHNKTGFPLTGRHIGLECVKCHTSGRMTEPVAHAACKDCHLDTHRGQFSSRTDGGACESCHTVDGFLPARYGIEQHAQSKFPLQGSHLAIPCITCHTPSLTDRNGAYAKFVFEDQTCKGCHRDIHRGQLDKYMTGKGCEFCHNVESWHNITFDHSTTGFPLIGKHDQTECMSCHARENLGTPEEMIRMAPLARECELCHKDPHRDQFVLDYTSEAKVKCSRCHTPDAWKSLVFDHNRDSKWPLDGAHQQVACNLCHKPQTDADGTFVLYRPLPSACKDCHGGASFERP